MQSVLVDTAAAGDNLIVAAQVQRRIRVLGYKLQAAGAVTVTFASGAGTGTKLTGAMSMITGVESTAPICPPSNMGNMPGFWFETNPGDALNLSLGGAIQVSGHVLVEFVNSGP